jgi:hypothetical protein
MKIIIGILFLLNIYIVNGQIKAITEKGDTVILHENGMWAYQNPDSTLSANDTIAWNNKPFLKNRNAKLFKKSKNVNVGVYFDQSKWGFAPGNIGESGEYTFMNKDKDLNATFITETTEIELSKMPEIVFLNAQQTAPDIEVISKEYRNVNGLKILCMKLKGSVRGIKANYLYYIYCNDTGIVQFVAYATPKQFSANYGILEDLLNGLSSSK